MINRRLALGLIATATTIDPSRIAFAKEKHHLNGKDLLGEKIKKNGKHKIHTTGKKADVFAEVSNGKITALPISSVWACSSSPRIVHARAFTSGMAGSECGVERERSLH